MSRCVTVHTLAVGLGWGLETEVDFGGVHEGTCIKIGGHQRYETKDLA